MCRVLSNFIQACLVKEDSVLEPSGVVIQSVFTGRPRGRSGRVSQLKLRDPRESLIAPSVKGPIWFTEDGRPATRRTFQHIWRGLTNRLELTPRKHNNKGTRYGYHPHETRDLASSIWTVSGANEKVCEFLMGHPKLIDSNLYKKFWKTHPQFVVDEYRKALPHLNLISQKPTPNHEDRERMKQLEEVAKMKSTVNALSRELEVMNK